MAQLHSKLKFYLEDNGKNIKDEMLNYDIRDDSDGNGAYLDVWNVDGVAKPTDEQLAAFETQANEWEANLKTSDELKASAKAKLIAGEPLTQEEADTIVL
tara:strand:- start:53 stop:352 length:300 start_codon:yes stop_codon:yes gene_type:complete